MSRRPASNRSPGGRLEQPGLDAENRLPPPEPSLAEAIIATAEVAIVAKALDGTVLKWNAGAERLFGYSAAEMEGTSITRLFPQDRLHEEATLIARVLAGRRVSRYVTQRIRKDGVVVDVSVTLAPLVGADGRISAVSKIVHDITPEKQLEADIEAGSLQHLHDTIPAMMHSIDAVGRLTGVSDRWLQRLGYTRREVLGQPISSFLATASRQIFLESSFPAFLAGRNVSNVEYQMVCRDGSLIDVELSARSERDAEGRVQGGLAVLSDVTARKAAEAALRFSEAFLERVGQAAGVGGWSVELATNALFWSQQTRRIHEVASDYVPTVEKALGFYTPESRTIIERELQQCIRDGNSYDVELQIDTANGRRVWVRAVGEPYLEGQTVTRIFGAFQDITVRKEAELALVAQHELMRVTLDSIGDAVITTDSFGLVQWLNPVAAQLTGWKIDDALGQPIDKVFSIVDEANGQPTVCSVTRALREDRSIAVTDHSLLVSRDGRQYGIQDSAAPIRDLQGNAIGIVLVFHDVSEQRRLVEEVSFRATHDALTGLMNRTEFERRLQDRLAYAHREGQVHALMYIDLDQFKVVNDACGHAAGDDLLRQVAVILKNVVRSRDTLARLGGDEFGVIMEHCTAAQAHRVASHICECMENYRFVHGDRRFRVGASVGLVPLDARWQDPAVVLQAADNSCYAAKEAGRNRVHEWAESDQTLKDRHGEMQWAARLEEALDENRFQLYGQRLAGLACELGGMHIEVLLRLEGDDGKIIGPATFFPAAERFHMASRLDRWVVKNVVRWMEVTDLEGIEMISVNLSGQSIGDRALQSYIADLVSGASFDNRKLCFEITETAAITHMGNAIEFISAMHALGVKIALDDFGAGASSFGYLKQLKVDILKIDGQFVRDLLVDRLDQAAVRCFREVAVVCGLKTIAEWVETEAVRDELRRIGIDYAQGYLIHRPEPLDQVVARRPAAVLSPA